jgi:type II secretory pathway component PulJ
MADGNVDTFKLVLEGASLVGTLIAVFVTLNIKATVAAIKLDQANNKAELVEKQTEVKQELTAANTKLNADLNSHNAAFRLELAVHTTLDEQRFHSVEKSMEDNNEAIKQQNKVLGEINRKLDRNYDNNHR